jgi:hypothetical protein
MPERSSKKRPRDLSQLAISIVDEATREDAPNKPDTEPSAEDRRAAAIILGRRGGAIGGPARASKLTPEQRQEIARVAAAARWKKKYEEI